MSDSVQSNKILRQPICIAAVLTLTTLLIACNSKEEMTPPPAGMHSLHLGKYGKPFVIFVPDTIKHKLDVIETSSGSLEVRSGKDFAMAINEQEADLVLLKKDLQDDEVNRLKRLIKDEPSAIMWESEVVQPEYHFFVNQKVNGADYSFEDIKSTEFEPFSESAITRMFESARNIQPNSDSR